MRRFLTFLLFFLFILGMGCVQAQDYYKTYDLESGMSADEIMRIKYHNKYSLFAEDYRSTNEIFYVDPSGLVRTKKALRQRIVKGGEDGLSYKDVIVVTYPTQVKGLAILTWTYEDPDKDQQTWLYLPSLKKVRKISASQDDDSFMGSDFTVQEVSTREFKDETYKLIGEKNFPGYKFEHTGEVKFKGSPCIVIEATSAKPRWYYDKRIVWMDKETGGNIFEEYYDRNGKLFKTIFRGWVLWDVDGKKYPTQTELEVKDLRTGHRTVILNDNVEYDRGVSENDFTVKALMRSRW